MTTLAQLVIKLITDTTEFTKAMDSASKKLTAWGSDLQRVGNAMTVGVTLPLVAAGAAAVKYASDLGETQNKASVVFGGMAEDVMAFGSTSADALGMSENAALTYASTYGSMLKNMGLAEDQVAEMSMSLTQLTADYASFHNLSPGEAFEKIKAGLVGSSEPLLALGKDLRVGAVESYALANGLGTSISAMSQAEIAAARYGLLMAQSGDELGDFARTSDGLANSTRILKAQLENTFASFGEVLIPTVTAFLQAATPVLQWFNDLPLGAKQAIVYVLMFAAALGPVLKVAGMLLTAGGKIAGLFGTGGALSGVGTWFVGLASKAVAAGGSLGGFMGTAAAAAVPVLALVAAIALLVVTIAGLGDEAWESVKMLAFIFFVSVGKLVKSVYDWFRNVGKAIMSGIGKGIADGWKWLSELVQEMATKLYETAMDALGIKSPSTVMAGIGRNMMLGLAEGIRDFEGRPVTATVNAVGNVANAATSVGGVRGGIGGGKIEVNIYGDLSDSAKRSLRAEVRQIFAEELAMATR